MDNNFLLIFRICIQKLVQLTTSTLFQFFILFLYKCNIFLHLITLIRLAVFYFILFLFFNWRHI